MEETKKSNKNVYLLILLLLLVVIGILLYVNYDKSNLIETQELTIEEQQTELSTKTEELEDLSLQYEALIQERDAMGLDNEELRAQAVELNNRIADLKKQGTISKSQLKKLEADLKEMRTLLDAKNEEIAALKEENSQLSTEVSTLQTDKRTLGDSLSQLNNVKTDLEKQVEIASVLRAENIEVQAVNEKGKIKTGGEYRSGFLHQVNVIFTFGDNKVAKKNSKQVYLRILDPSGTVLFDPALGGGSFDTAEGATVSYSAAQSVNFDNTGQQVKFLYGKLTGFKDGKHKVEIWCEGVQIGQSSFVVK